MIKTEAGLVRALRGGGRVVLAWGGLRVRPPGGGPGRSVLPSLVVWLEEKGRIRRADDGSSCVGREWILQERNE